MTSLLAPATDLAARQLPMPTTPIGLVVCDMAGTTIDDGGLVYEALRDCVTAGGATVAEEDLQRWMGTDKTEAITALLGLGGGATSADHVALTYADFQTRLQQAYRDQPPRALPGVEQSFTELRARKIKIALTTGFTTEVAEPLLASIGWSIGDQLDAVVCVDDVAQGRPAPYLIHRAMERTHCLDVATVVSVGDTAVDLQSAVNAGVTAVGVLTGKLGREDLGAERHHLVISGVSALLTAPELSPRWAGQHPKVG